MAVVKEVSLVKESLNQGGDKNNRLKAFLSLEPDEKMDKIIADIGEQLKNNPEIADLLFSEYAKMADDAEKIVNEIEKIYAEIFSDKKVNKNELTQTILKRASSLFIDVQRELKTSAEQAPDETIRKIVEKIKNNQELQKKQLYELVTVCNNLKKLKNSLVESMFLEGDYYSIYSQLYGNPDDYKSAKELNMAIANGKIEKWWMDKEIKKRPEKILDRLDDRILKTLIAISEKASWDIEDMLIKEGFYEAIEEAKKRKENIDSIDFATFRRYKNILISESEKREKLKKLRRYQQIFEKKFESLVYGHESASLPENYQKCLAVDIENYQAELPRKEDGSYLPVGISSMPPSENEIHQKPIDALLWLLWLNNQGQQTELLVADTIQRHNYAVLPEKQRPADPKSAAVKNGQKDRQWYLAVKKVLGLENIVMSENTKFSRYEEKVEKNPEVQRWLGIISELEKISPAMARAIGNLVEPTIRERVFHGLNTKEEEWQASRSIDMYGKEELAFILAIPEQKIGHKKEIRYDMLARIIPVYEELRKRAGSIPELSDDIENIRNRDQVLMELSLWLAYFNNFSESYFSKAKLNLFEKRLQELKKQGSQMENGQGDKKAVGIVQQNIRGISVEAKKLRGVMKQFQNNIKENDRIEMVENAVKRLGISENPKGVAIKWREIGGRLSQEEWFKKLDLPKFYYPKGISSLSFDINGDGEFMNFREPYSTYKGENEEELAIESNQIIASTNLLAAAKIMVLSEKGQKTYFEKVLRPLVVNYYVATSKSKEEAMTRFRENFEGVTTIAEVIELIQQKIIWPLEMELKSVKIRQ